MTKYKIFLASSSELKEDRQQFEIFINRKNKDWADYGIFLELMLWEDFLDALAPTRLQDEYDEAVRTCDIFIMLFHIKLGKYTEEEYDTAFRQFNAAGKPLIFSYFKDAEITTGSVIKEDLMRLWAFQEKLDKLGHFYTRYKNSTELVYLLNHQLDILANNGVIQFKTVPAQGGRKIPHALTRPPFVPNVFIGRKEELMAIKNRLFGGGSFLLLVNGVGGIGKTSLVATYYHMYQYEYTHVAWVCSDQNIANALLSLAEPLGLRFEDTMPATARLNILLQALADLQKPCLLVIDNANELEDLEVNYQNLCCCSNFHILLITRITEFSQVEQYHIDGLPVAEALELFRKYYPEHQSSDDGIFQQIWTAIGGNTLVIELLAKNLRQINRLRTNYSLADLLVDLQSKGLLALSHSQAVSTNYHGSGRIRKEKPEDIISAIYDLSQLTEPEIALLSVFAVLPAESISFAIVATLLPSGKNFEQTLAILAQKGWLEYNQAARSFKCSPVAQEIIKKSNKRLIEDCRTLIATLKDKLDYEIGTGYLMNATYEEAAQFARYAESVVRAFTEAEESLAVLCERIGSYHYFTGNLEKALRFYENYLKLTKELYEACPNNISVKNGLAISYFKLGDIHRALGTLDQALGFYENYLRMTKELYESDPNNVSIKNNLAISYSKLGETHTALGNLDQALEFYNDYRILVEELYEAYPNNSAFKNGLAISNFRLGEIHTVLGNIDQALGFFEDEIEPFKELYEANPNNVSFKNSLAVSYLKLGDTHKALGNLNQALGFYEEYLSLSKELYEAFPNNVSFKKSLSISFSKLGDTYIALDNLDRALGFYENYLSLIKELNEEFPNNISFKSSLATSYSKLGNTHHALGNLDQALRFFEVETSLFKEIYEIYPNNVSVKKNLADSYFNLAQTHRNLKNLDKSLIFLEEYYRLNKELSKIGSRNTGSKEEFALSYEKTSISQISAAKELFSGLSTNTGSRLPQLQELLKILRRDYVLGARKSVLQEMLDNYKKFLNELPSLLPEFACDPDDNIRADIVRWILTHYNEFDKVYDTLLRNLAQDKSSIVHQAIVETVSKRFDYLPDSIRLLISQLDYTKLEVQMVKGGGMLVGKENELILRVTNHDTTTLDKVEIAIIEPSAEYQVKSTNPVSVDTLPAGQTTEFRFRLEMKTPKQIAVNYKVNGELRGIPLYINGIQDNPYVYGAPVEDSSFFGRRKQLEEIIQAITKPTKQDILIVGERRTGKTSLIYQLQKRIEKPFIPVYVILNDTCELKTESLLEFILHEISVSLVKQNLLSEDWKKHQFRYTGFTDNVSEIIEAVKANLVDAKIVLFLDEANYFLKLEVVHPGLIGIINTLRGYHQIDERLQNILRAALQSNKLGGDFRAVVAGTTELSTYISQASSPFFNHFRFVILKPFTFEEVQELITKPASILGYSYSSRAIDLIMRLSGGQPYYCQALCYEAFDIALKDKRFIINDQDIAIAEEKLTNDLFNSYLSYFWNRANKFEKLFLSKLARGSHINNFSKAQIKRLLDWGIIIEDRGAYAFSGGLIEKWTKMASGRGY